MQVINFQDKPKNCYLQHSAFRGVHLTHSTIVTYLSESRERILPCDGPYYSTITFSVISSQTENLSILPNWNETNKVHSLSL